MGDVKYSLTTGAWVRSHLYQATTFAAGYRSSHALVVGFRPPSVRTTPPRPVQVGEVHVSYLAWPADEVLRPEDAGAILVEDCRRGSPSRVGAEDSQVVM